VLCPVEVGKGARDVVPAGELLALGQWFEQAPAHDLETLFRAGRRPGGFDPPNDIPQARQGGASAQAADLLVVSLSVGRRRRIRCGQADDQQALPGKLGRLGQRLGKAEMGFETADLPP
jgi:hypothetical protein